MTFTPPSLGEDLDALRSSARAFARREIDALVVEAERTERFPRDVLRSSARHGFLGAHYPERVGVEGAASWRPW